MSIPTSSSVTASSSPSGGGAAAASSVGRSESQIESGNHKFVLAPSLAFTGSVPPNAHNVQSGGGFGRVGHRRARRRYQTNRQRCSSHGRSRVTSDRTCFAWTSSVRNKGCPRHMGSQGTEPGGWFGTRAIHAGQPCDPSTGAVIIPVSLSTTFVQGGAGSELGQGSAAGFDYSRSGNPTRQACIASLATKAPPLSFALTLTRSSSCSSFSPMNGCTRTA